MQCEFNFGRNLVYYHKLCIRMKKIKKKDLTNLYDQNE